MALTYDLEILFMEDLVLDFPFYLIVASIIVFTFSSLALVYFLYKGLKTGEKVKKNIYELGKDLADERLWITVLLLTAFRYQAEEYTEIH